MQKEVLIFMTSVQRGGSVGEDKLEIITAGQYHFKNGKHYVTYDDVSEDGRTRERNIIKIRNDRAEVIKKGETSVHMIFEKDKKNVSCYDVPYGKMMVGLKPAGWKSPRGKSSEPAAGIPAGDGRSAHCGLSGGDPGGIQGYLQGGSVLGKLTQSSDLFFAQRAVLSRRKRFVQRKTSHGKTS